VPGIERLLGLSLALLRPSLGEPTPPPDDVILRISFLITWSCPGALAALEEFSDVVNFIWDSFHSPEESGGEDSGLYVLTWTVAALALPVGLEELRGRALGWIAEVDPGLNSAAILGSVFVLLVCSRNQPAQLVTDLWVTEKLAGSSRPCPMRRRGLR
jgi:hypothetical protein